MKNASRVFFVFIIILCSPGCRWPRRKAVSDVLPTAMVVTDIPVSFRTQKPRVLIFSSVGGGGHMSAAQAITSYLGDRYEVNIVNIIAEAAGNFDVLRFISGNTVAGEDLYNFFLRHGMSRTVGMYCSLGHVLMSLCARYLDARVGEFLDHAQPDIIISVIPFFNGVIHRTAHARGLPFAVVTCDLNTVNYFQGMDSSQSELFRYGIAFKDPAIVKVVDPARISPESIRVVGFPVRESFFVRHNKKELRAQFNFPEETPTVMIMMGAVGGRSVLGYLRKLVKMKTKMHVVVCVGRNEALKNSIENLVLPAHMSISVFGYTDKIAELMQASDLLITKPGPTSICEALYARVPLLLDGTTQPIFWEIMNVDFVVQNGFGEVVTTLRHVPIQVKKMLENFDQRAAIIKAMEDFVAPDPGTNIRLLVEDLLQQAAQKPYEVVTGGIATV